MSVKILAGGVDGHKATAQDVVERFHLFCALAFVLVEDMNNSGTWRPSRGLAWQCAYFLGAEVVIGAPHVPCPCTLSLHEIFGLLRAVRD